MARFALTGSERGPVAGARVVGPEPADAVLRVSVILRPGPDRVATGPDLDAVERFARAQGLAVILRHAARRTVILGGTAAACEAAFGVTLHCYEAASVRYRGRTGEIHLPVALEGVVIAVLGLDNRPQARPQFRPAASRPAGFTPVQIADLYGLPPGDGAGHCIALIELGGGYREADIDRYFAELGTQRPHVVAIGVDGGENAPTGDANGPDGEVLLDIQVAGGVAPAARIAVYFAPNTSAGFLDAITTAIHDPTHAPGVVSISWGGPEESFTQQALTAFDQAFADAAALGIVVTAACGDNGSSDGEPDGADHVDFPAASPNALACGGTSLRAAGDAIAAETVWNNGRGRGATGGGVSRFFPVPDYQSSLSSAPGVSLTGRGVPDIGGNADPETGYQVLVDGVRTIVGGTSAVAPLWAALIVRALPPGVRPGFLHPRLYATPGTLRDITQGDNGRFAAAVGWDACTGLGSPNGPALAALISDGASVS